MSRKFILVTKHIFKIICSFSLLFFAFVQLAWCATPNQQYSYDTLELYAYNQKQQLYLIDGPVVKMNFIHFYLPTAPAGSLYFNPAQYPVVWLADGKFIAEIKDNNRTFSMDSLQKVYAANTLFSVLGAKGVGGIAILHQKVKKVEEESEKQNIQSKARSGYKDFSLIGILLILLGFVVFKSKNEATLTHYFKVGNTLSFRNKQETLMSLRILSKVNFWFIVLVSSMASFIMIVALNNHAILSYFSFELNSFQSHIALWFIGIFGIFFIYFLKLVLVYVVSVLFGLSQFRIVHYLNYIRYSFLTYILLIAVFIVLFFGFGLSLIETKNGIVPLLLTLFGIRCFVLLLKTLSFGRYRKLYLFSYLCATEIVPFILIVRFFQ